MIRERSALIVEEIIFIRRIIKGVLRAAGFKCYEAGQLSQAIDSYHLFRPDVVVIGTLQNGTTSVRAIEVLKRYDPMANIVMCSDDATRAVVLEAIRAGASDFVARPFKSERLTAAVLGVMRSDGSAPDTRRVSSAWRQAEIIQIAAPTHIQRGVS